jgi:hypothetical protein
MQIKKTEIEAQKGISLGFYISAGKAKIVSLHRTASLCILNK